MSESEIPKAIWTGTFRIYGVALRCSSLDNGTRVIHADDVKRLFAALESGATITVDEAADIERFAHWQAGEDQSGQE